MTASPRSSSYVPICPLAKGGMGRVDLVLRREGRFERLYAIKRMHPVWREEPALRAMFIDEARIAGLVRHPHVVSVSDVGEDREGPFLVMEYVEGVPASLLVTASTSAEQALPVALCLEVVRQAAEGLHAAHELVGHDGRSLGLVHRDVSPQNILVGFDGIVRVTDFGIAKAYGRTTRTSTGLLKGKVGYMSPEQLAYQQPDRRSDLFSLGVVLYEMLSGRRLYQDEDPNVTARRILGDPPPDIGEEREDVPMEVVALLFELLAKDRDARPPDAGAVAERLRDVLAVMAVEQGSFSLGPWLEGAFGEQRAERRDEIARALEATRGSIALPDADAPGVAQAVDGAVDATSVFLRAVRRPPWAWVAAGAVLALGVGAGGWWWARSEPAGALAPVAAHPAEDAEPGPTAVVAPDGPARRDGARDEVDGEPEAEGTPVALETVFVELDDAEAPADAAEDAPDDAPAEETAAGAGAEAADDRARLRQERRRQRLRRIRRARSRDETPIWRWE